MADNLTAEARMRLVAVASRMRTLLADPSWEAYTEQLGDMEARYIEQMITAPDPQKFAHAQGYIQGLRMAHSLPNWLIEQADKAQASK